jgi:hypothetical protein
MDYADAYKLMQTFYESLSRARPTLKIVPTFRDGETGTRPNISPNIFSRWGNRDPAKHFAKQISRWGNRDPAKHFSKH